MHEAVLPPRMNRVFQGVDECGFHVLAAMEQEAAAAMGFGKASTGWPAHSAKKWHERLHKVTNALRTEQNKRLDELKQHKKKEFSTCRPIFPFVISLRHRGTLFSWASKDEKRARAHGGHG